MVAGDAVQEPPDDRRPDPLAAMSGSRPDVDQPGVADPVGKQPRGRDDLSTAPDDCCGVAVLERPAQLLRRAPVVEAVSRQGVVERLPVDAREVVADDDRPRQLRPPGRWVSSGSG